MINYLYLVLDSSTYLQESDSGLQSTAFYISSSSLVVFILFSAIFLCFYVLMVPSHVIALSLTNCDSPSAGNKISSAADY